MGSRSRTLSQDGAYRAALLRHVEVHGEDALTDQQKSWLKANPRRHKCAACGTGGHKRNAKIVLPPLPFPPFPRTLPMNITKPKQENQ